MASTLSDSDLQNGEYQQTTLFANARNVAISLLQRLQWINSATNGVNQAQKMATQIIDPNRNITMCQIEANLHWFSTNHDQLLVETTMDAVPAPIRSFSTPQPATAARTGMMANFLHSVRSLPNPLVFRRRQGLRSSPSAIAHQSDTLPIGRESQGELLREQLRPPNHVVP
jgi:hypothetical protein